MRPPSEETLARMARLAASLGLGIDPAEPVSVQCLPALGVYLTQYGDPVESDHPGVPTRYPYTRAYLSERMLRDAGVPCG